MAATTADSPAFWLYSSGTTGVPKGVMHRHGNMQATYDTYARPVLQVSPDDRFLSVAKLFFAYGLGNSLTFPFARRRDRAPRTRGDRRRRASPSCVAHERPTLFFASPGFVAALLDAELPADAFASVRATVTAGESLPADLQRRFTRAVRPSGARRHRLDRGAAHLPVQPRRQPSGPARRGTPVAGLRGQAARRRRRGGHRRPTRPGYLHVRGPRSPPATGAATDATAAGVPGRLAAHGRRVHALRRRLLDVPRSQQRHDQGRRHLGVAGGGRERAGRAPRRARGRGRRRAATPHGSRRPSPSSSPRPGTRSTPTRSTPIAASAWRRSSGPAGSSSSTSCPKTATGKIQRFALREQLASERPSKVGPS